MRLRWYLGDCRGAGALCGPERKKIDYHNHLYYDLDAPELDDYAYDALTRELKALEVEHPEFVNESSPHAACWRRCLRPL